MLATITELRAALLRLVGTQASDPELVLRGEELNDVLDEALQVGVWNAQLHLIDIGLGNSWLTSTEIEFDAEDDAGIRRAMAPADFLRFGGGEDISALREADGRSWGALLDDTREIYTAGSGLYFWADDYIGVTKQSNLPSSTLWLEYYRRITLPTGTAEISSFAEPARPLIPAEAASHVLGDYWIPAPDGVAALERRIERHLGKKRIEAARALRQTLGRQIVREPPTYGNHYWMI